MAVFAFATIIAWYYMGKQTFQYLLERISRGNYFGFSQETWEMVYRTLYLLAVFGGCVCQLQVVWLVSDLWNGLMIYPNLLAILWLSKQVDFHG